MNISIETARYKFQFIIIIIINGYPLAPEKRVTEPWKMSDYQLRLMADLGLELPNTEKLVLTLEDKNNYVVHYKNLQFYLSQGMRLKKLHRVI